MDWQQRVIRRIRRGESAALGELYDRVAGRVYRGAVVMTESMSVAEEITRAVFVEVWRRPGCLVGHEDRLGDFLTQLACERAAIWRARHRAERPSPSGGGTVAGVDVSIQPENRSG